VQILKDFEKYDLEVVVSGQYWLDIMNKNINKGMTII
jgi:hydroxymethylpyrimidine pyrophosphatase-like HAD family hydrolase